MVGAKDGNNDDLLDGILLDYDDDEGIVSSEGVRERVVLGKDDGCNEWTVIGFELGSANGATEGFDDVLLVGWLLGRG